MVDQSVSQWFYVWLAFGITWFALIVYFFRLRARRMAALRQLTDRMADVVHSAGAGHGR